MTTYDPSKPPAMAPVADHPLSPRGRFARLAYLAWYLVITFVLIVVILASLYIYGNGSLSLYSFEHSETILNIKIIYVLTIDYLVFLVFTIIFTIRRLHDLNQSGWLSLLILVPLVNVFFMLYVMIAPGTKGSNNFGLPRPNKGWESVLGIIYIILSVLAIIGGIAVMTMLGGMSGDMSNLANMTKY
jgi:uncharacterized membrane protein YhaH (DUF805 family)